MPEIYYSKAVNEALDEELARDPNVILIGEDIGLYGGAFGATKGLYEKYGAERLWETPISENSFTGIGVGAAAGLLLTALAPDTAPVIAERIVAPLTNAFTGPLPPPRKETRILRRLMPRTLKLYAKA